MKTAITFIIISLFSVILSFGSDSITTQNKRGNIDSINAGFLILKDTIFIEKDNSNIPVIIEEKTKKSDYSKYIYSVIALLLGFTLNKVSDYLLERKRINKYGKRWISEIESLNEPLNKQILYLEDFLAEHLKDKPGQIPRPNLISNLNCEVFKSMDKGEFLKYLEYSKKQDVDQVLKLSNNINGTLTIIAHLHDAFADKFGSFLKQKSGYIRQLSDSLNELSLEFSYYGDSLESRNGENATSNPTYLNIFKLFAEQLIPNIESGNFDLRKIHSFFLVPLLKELVELRLDKDSRKLSRLTNTCLVLIKKINAENSYFQEHIQSSIKQFKEQEKHLIEIINQLK